jgi:hypothetical protein
MGDGWTTWRVIPKIIAIAFAIAVVITGIVLVVKYGG